MSTRVKFLILLFLGFTGVTLSIMIFMKTDYAIQERRYFHSYPYREMASRKIQNMEITPQKNENSPVILSRNDHKAPSVQKIEQSLSPAPAKPELTHRKIPPSLPLKIKRKRIAAQTAPVQKEIQPLKTAVTPDWRHAASRGYDAYARADYQKAIGHFEQALKLSPHNSELRLQLAYAYKISGRNAKAVESFKTVLDQNDGAGFPLKREIEQLERRFDISAYAIYRDDRAGNRQLTGPDLTRSQAGGEISYQPEKTGFRNGKKIQVYGRLLSAIKNVEPDPDSYQAGVGVRIKPLSRHNLVLSAERLVKVGRFARNDWMIRAGYSYDHNSDYREDKKRWWSYSLYLDAALIDFNSPDIFLTSQTTGGYNVTLGQGLVMQPRITGLITWQKDSFRQASLIEGGPGLNLRYYFNDTKYAAYRSYLDLTVEYRVKISGNSINHSGPIVSLMLYF